MKQVVKFRTPLKSSVENCFYCGKKFKDNNPRTLEHLISKSNGGSNEIFNYAVTCHYCNNTLKGSKNHDEFIKEHPEFIPNIRRYYRNLKGKIIVDGFDFATEQARRLNVNI